MITKFKSIKNLAVFKSFDWDREVRDKGNNVVLFKRINILYGRNYSGKTTLARIVRAMETGFISDKYENAECCVCIKDNPDVHHSNFNGHNKTIRVFSEDFITENLKFIVNPDENVEPFAILGGDNAKIEEEINELNEKLGSNEENNETGFYKDLKSLKALFLAANNAHAKAISSLESQLSSKATGRPNGIRYQSEKFGDQNYNISKLRSDIKDVKNENFAPITDSKKTEAEKVLTEQVRAPISELASLTLSFNILSTKTKEIVTRKIGQADKIQSLVKDAVLNRWVKEGKDIHQDKFDTCAFCDNPISDSRWAELDKHFDEESDELEIDINNLLKEIKIEKSIIDTTSGINRNNFYSKFHTEVDALAEDYKTDLENYKDSLESLENQLVERKKDLLNSRIFQDVKDYSLKLKSTRTKFEGIRIKSNEYSENLNVEQTQAKINLKLREIHDFINDIKYDDLKKNINSLQKIEEEKKVDLDKKEKEIGDILNQISAKQRELKDESKGADKVNEYLNDYFGHSFLSLKAIEFEDEETNNKSFRFEIHRENKKAYHLSEGEKSLIAFCYFVAKLHDVDTKSKNPIIWIDDPISSLDSNHIFFIYTLINTQIFTDDDFEQLFVSTHNLNFLKYLKRLPGALNKNKSKYFLIERNDSFSTISEMPRYIKDYVTEFNYLFQQIYKCSKMETVNDDNYTVFYNFGNNARKFLEIYLYYKYPDSSEDCDKMKKFFNNEEIPTVLTDRINNEYSHLAGVFERGATIVEVPEMNRAAKLIVTKIKEDEDQYNALLRSIGELEQ